MTATVTRIKPATVGSLIDNMWALREKKRSQEVEIKATEAAIEELTATLLGAMDSDGVVKATGKSASASVTEAVRPNVTDWDVFYKFIHKNKYWHLLERRPSVTGCRELFETKGGVPGVEPYVKRTINLRTV